MFLIMVTNYKKKFLILFSIILLWLLIIIGTGILIDETVKYTVTVNNQLSISCPSIISISSIYSKDANSAPYLEASNSIYKHFVDFKSAEEGFEFKYPSIFKIDKQTFPGSEILYHIDFQNKQDKQKGGFVQVWSLPFSLEKFLETSKQSSTIEFIDFASNKIKVNDLDGYFWEYTIKSNSENFKALEVFLSKNTKLYRISYSMPERKYNKIEYELFWNIVDSLKVN